MSKGIKFLISRSSSYLKPPRVNVVELFSGWLIASCSGQLQPHSLGSATLGSFWCGPVSLGCKHLCNNNNLLGIVMFSCLENIL